MMKLSVVTIMLFVSCSQQAVSKQQVKAEGDLNEKFHHLKNQEERRSKYTENADKFQAVWDQIEKLVEDVTEIKKENTNLKQANMRLVEDVAELKKENSYIKQANMKLVENSAVMKRENTYLKRGNMRLVQDVAELKKENSYVKQANMKLVKDVAEIKQSYMELVEEVAELKKENSYIKQANMKLVKDVAEIKQSYMELVEEVAEMKNNIGNNQSNVKEENFVSFTAYATEDKTYNEGDVVEFKGVINNYGNHYDNAAFIFTCPVSGYYMMSVAVRIPGGGNNMHAAIVMDNTILIEMIAQDDNAQDQASNLAVSLCNANQQIWVECSWGTNNRVQAGTTTSFTVTLLKIA